MALCTELYKKSIWVNKDIVFLFGTEITEYDIHAAGPSICREFNLLPKDTLDEIDKMDKKAKNIKIGLIQRKDKEFTKKLLQGFEEARKRFFDANDIHREDIVSIKKDAIFIQGRYCENTDFGHIHFASKNRYSSYFRLNRLEFYINTRLQKIDIKGLGQGDSLKEVITLHKEYMLKFILKFAKMREDEVGRIDVRRYLTKFISAYRKKELPIGYYRELAQGNSFKVWDEGLQKYIRISDTAEVEPIDIGLNYMEYIVPLTGLYI